MPEVAILPELAKLKLGEEKLDFAAAISHKKWQLRGNALDELSKLLNVGSDQGARFNYCIC